MPLSGSSFQRHQVQHAKPLIGRRDAVLVDAREGRPPPPGDIRRACPLLLGPCLTRPGVERQHRRQRGDDPATTPGARFPPELGQKSLGDQPRRVPPVPSRIGLPVRLIKSPDPGRSRHRALGLLRLIVLRRRPRAPLSALEGLQVAVFAIVVGGGLTISRLDGSGGRGWLSILVI
jgi:hypothetical protein